MKDFLSLILPLCRAPGDHAQLWEAVYLAQHDSARNNPSVSKMLVNLVGQSSGSFIHALTAGMMSAGERHAPIAAARDDLLLYNTLEKAKRAAEAGLKINGFGNTFFKNGSDPAWRHVERELAQSYPETQHDLELTGFGLHAAGKRVFPNPAGFTAAAANACELIRGIEEALFVVPRLNVWVREYIITLGGL